jgi:hypothetical protein
VMSSAMLFVPSLTKSGSVCVCNTDVCADRDGLREKFLHVNKPEAQKFHPREQTKRLKSSLHVNKPEDSEVPPTWTELKA